MRLLPIVLAASFSAVALPMLRAEDEPHPRGMDVIKSVETVKRWLGPDSTPSDKPWANALAGLTNHDPEVHAPAVRSLIVAGIAHPQAVLKDLTTIAEDPDWRVRSRVIQILNGIGGEAAAPLALQLSRDRESQLRELAALALGRCRGDAVLPRLLEMLAAPEGNIRQAAANGLTYLGDSRSIGHLITWSLDSDDLVQREMRKALNSLLGQPEAVVEAVHLLTTSTGERRDALIEAVAVTGDRRLCLALTAIAKDPGQGGRATGGRDPSVWTQFLAVRSLATCGDLRACRVLIALADGEQPSDLRDQAANTLRLLTGFQAQPGRAWKIWWADHETGIQHLEAREAFLAQLHDVSAPITREALAVYSTEELTPLVDAVLGEPAGRLAAWFPGQAMVALRQDEPQRWTPVLGSRCRGLPLRNQPNQVGLILLIDDLGGPEAGKELLAIATDMNKREKSAQENAEATKTAPPDLSPVKQALRLALERRNLTLPE